EHLPEARCREPDRGEPLGTAPWPAGGGARRDGLVELDNIGGPALRGVVCAAGSDDTVMCGVAANVHEAERSVAAPSRTPGTRAPEAPRPPGSRGHARAEPARNRAGPARILPGTRVRARRQCLRAARANLTPR